MSKARDRRRRWERRNAVPDAAWPSPPPGYQQWLDALLEGARQRQLRPITHLLPRKDPS